MKKLVLIAGMFAFVNMASADEAAVEENAVVEDVADVDNEDGLTSIYASLGLGWEWFENKGDIDYKDGIVRSINKQKINRFRGMVGLGYQHLFMQHFLAGLEFDCEFAQKKDKEIYNSLNVYHNSKIQNKGITPAIYAKLGYAWCNKHVVYVKLGGQWKRTRVLDLDGNAQNDSYNINKFVFAGALGYQCKFTKKFSAFGEVTYSARQKNDKDGFIGLKYSTKTGESWGFNLGVTYHMLTK